MKLATEIAMLIGIVFASVAALLLSVGLVIQLWRDLKEGKK